MDTTSPQTRKFTVTSKVRVILINVLLLTRQSAQLIVKYYFLFFSVLIFFSCQRNLAPTTASNKKPTPEITPPAIIAATTIAIDPPLIDHRSSGFDHEIQSKVNTFYTSNNLQTKWLGENGPNELCYAFLDQLKNITAHGLNPADYDVDSLGQKLDLLYNTKPVMANNIAVMDIHITKIFFLFAEHLHNGRVKETGDTKNIWIREKKNEDPSGIALLLEVKNTLQLQEIIQRLQPSHIQYIRLQRALELYRSLEKALPSGIVIRTGERIRPCERHPAIALIREKLSATDQHHLTIINDSISGLLDSLYYDENLVAAVKVFQQRHGLEPDGVIGEKTLKFLNQSFQEKADIIALNMERLRWVPENPGDHFITVNIPEFKLRIFREEKQTLEMKVIVGAIQNATPVFHDSLEHIVFSPTWTVPPSIIKAEILPRLIKDSLYYAERNFSFYKNGVEIDPATERWDSVFNINQYRVVQKPGSDNSLGLVKFVMPNSMNIYLHDTPDHRAFAKNYRALSHGCIRLDDPALFAAYLLQEQKDWNSAAINKAMVSSKPTQIALKKHYQVYLLYNTVWVDDNGEVNFREDIYGHDKRQLQQLKPVKKGVAPSAVASL
jgi:murein L,D-transpeptidase YcbB/YkuD